MRLCPLFPLPPPSFLHCLHPARIINVDVRKRLVGVLCSLCRCPGYTALLDTLAAKCPCTTFVYGAPEHFGELALLKLVIAGGNPFKEPVGMPDPWHRVWHPLHGGWNCNQLLYHASETLNVVVPVQDGAQVKVMQRVVTKKFAQVVLLDARLGVEDGDGDSSLCDGSAMRLFGNDKLAGESLVLDHLCTQKFGQSLGRRDSRRLLAAVLCQRLGHALVLGDQVDQLLVVQRGALGKEYIEPLIGHLCHGCIALDQGGAKEKLFKDLLLKVLDELQLAASFDLKALELGEGAIVLKDSIPLLE